jgi:quinol monooxygenase YgiN
VVLQAGDARYVLALERAAGCNCNSKVSLARARSSLNRAIARTSLSLGLRVQREKGCAEFVCHMSEQLTHIAAVVLIGAWPDEQKIQQLAAHLKRKGVALISQSTPTIMKVHLQRASTHGDHCRIVNIDTRSEQIDSTTP